MIDAIVATYGDEDVWSPLAQRAAGSIMAQSMRADTLSIIHGETLAQARNEGASKGSAPWLLFLDADDLLDWHYVEEMTAAAEASEIRSDAKWFVLQPANVDVMPDGTEVGPACIPERDLSRSNFLIIGTLLPRALFERAGGFQEWPTSEDWALQLRLRALGAKHIPVPEAIYRVTVNRGSRNFQVTGKDVRDIKAAHQQWLRDEGLT